jgi:hypothetical protein
MGLYSSFSLKKSNLLYPNVYRSGTGWERYRIQIQKNVILNKGSLTNRLRTRVGYTNFDLIFGKKEYKSSKLYANLILGHASKKAVNF